MKIEAKHIKSCLINEVGKWDKNDAIDTLLGKKEGRHGNFLLAESRDWPANETFFDASMDSEYIYVSVLSLCSCNKGRTLEGIASDSDVVEVLFDPYHDHVGFFQYGTGDNGGSYENSHWPYRKAEKMNIMDLPWSVETETIIESDILRFFFFKFDRKITTYANPIGFNVGRAQLESQEASSWNVVSEGGFPDPSCFGHLWVNQPEIECLDVNLEIEKNRLQKIVTTFSQESEQTALSLKIVTPSGKEFKNFTSIIPAPECCINIPEEIHLGESGRYRIILNGENNVSVAPGEFYFDFQVPGEKRNFQFQGTYDWPDHILNVPYGPEDLQEEIKWYRKNGLERVYWLDNNNICLNANIKKLGFSEAAENLEKTTEKFGTSDHLQSAVDSAHNAGLEFITLFKPFEKALGFVKADILKKPEFFMRRNPDWKRNIDYPIRTIRLYQRDNRSFPVSEEQIVIWQEIDGRWSRVQSEFQINERVQERAEYLWFPSGKVDTGESREVRCMEISGLELKGTKVCLEFINCDENCEIRNREYMLAELIDNSGNEVQWSFWCYENSSKNKIDSDGKWWQEWNGSKHQACWARLDSDNQRLLNLKNSSIALEFNLEISETIEGVLDPGFKEAREFWLDYLSRGINAGADGVGLRIAHHNGVDDWSAYMFAEPILNAFREQKGRNPEATMEDFTLVRQIRGAFYTDFIREAKAMTEKHEKKLILHLENRMLVPAEVDNYTQIFWDWRTWIQEKLCDEIDLKYIGPNCPDTYQEIIPLARQNGIKVNYITATPEPRSKPRSINEAPLFAEQAIKGGLDGINLYELWLYRRMTKFGTPITRGSGEAIIQNMRHAIDNLQQIK